MNRTIKDATIKRFHYDDHAQLRRHLTDFVDAYNFGPRLKTLKAPPHTQKSAIIGLQNQIGSGSIASINAGLNT